MNVFEFDIWTSVRRNGEFSHNVSRTQLVHAMNEELARKQITLREGRVWHEGKDHEYEVVASDEFIYGVRKIGTVTIQPFYVYSDGRPPRPVNLGK